MLLLKYSSFSPRIRSYSSTELGSSLWSSLPQRFRAGLSSEIFFATSMLQGSDGCRSDRCTDPRAFELARRFGLSSRLDLHSIFDLLVALIDVRSQPCSARPRLDILANAIDHGEHVLRFALSVSAWVDTFDGAFADLSSASSGSLLRLTFRISNFTRHSEKSRWRFICASRPSTERALMLSGSPEFSVD